MKLNTADSVVQIVLNHLYLGQQNWANEKRDSEITLDWAKRVAKAAYNLVANKEQCLELGIPDHIIEITRACYLGFVPLVFKGQIYVVSASSKANPIVSVEGNWVQLEFNEDGTVNKAHESKELKPLQNVDNATYVALCLSKGVLS